MRLIAKIALLAFTLQSVVFALTGKVQNAQGTALAGVLVTLVNAGHSTSTNVSGDFTLLEPGQIKAHGLQAFQFQVRQSAVSYQLPQSAPVQFEVLNLMGKMVQTSPKKVLKQGANVFAISQKLGAGLYLLRYQIGNAQGTLPLHVSQANLLSLRSDLQMALKKTAEGAEDSLQLEMSGYTTKRVAVLDYNADLGVLVLQSTPSSSSATPSSSSSSKVGNTQTCIYSTTTNTLTCTEKTYKTVVIGTQTWMAENLNYGTMVTSAAGQLNNSTVEKFCYGDNAVNCTTGGGLYTWAEAMALPSTCITTKCATHISSVNHQGICPIGWHIPKATEWNTLATYLGGESAAGAKMKLNATGFIEWDETAYNYPNVDSYLTNDGNSSGFSAFPAGHRFSNGVFSYRSEGAYFWEATENDASNAGIRYLYYKHSVLVVYNASKNSGASVRCLRDNSDISSSSSVVTPSSSSAVSPSSSSVIPSSSSSIFQTGTPIIYGGQTYKTVVIGTQTWMAENLNYGTMVLDADGQVNDAVVEKFCYEDDADNCTTDGGLYTWAETMALPNTCNSTYCATQISSGNHQGICPTGWHIPKSAEWNTLATYLGGASVAGKKMKLNATGFSSWDGLNNNDGNSSGFSAFPAGYRDYNGVFDYRGSNTTFWQATEDNASDALERYLNNFNSRLGDYYDHYANYHTYKSYGFSVRCLRDN